MTEEKTCYNCGNKNCIVYYSTAKKDCKRHYETYEYTNFDCVNHDKWEEMKVEEGLALASTWNKALNSMNKYLEEERDKFRNMVFDKDEQLTKAKKIIKNLLDVAKFYNHYRDKGAVMDITPIYDAEQFLKEETE